ncbi:chloroperoxidase [bacterium]|nr:chloroperoxidase [bacterium]
MNSEIKFASILSFIFIIFACFAGTTSATDVEAQGFRRGHREALGARFDASASQEKQAIEPAAGLDLIHRWNSIAINASGLDHTPVAQGENRVFGEQLGPGRSSRAIAIVHIAIVDVLNAIVGGYESYTGIASAPADTSSDAAIAQAANDTLMVLFPSQKKSFDHLLAQDLNQIPNGPAKSHGVHLGKKEAKAILVLRTPDGSQQAEQRVGIEFICSIKPGKWRQDPISMIPLALGAYWKNVQPFVIRSATQFRVSPPPALASPEYAAAFKEVKALGGNGKNTPTRRTKEQTRIGIYWAYDGTPSLPRLYIPLGAPASNLQGPNFTPPFPAYPSGHAGFGGALFEILRKFYKTDNIAFTFVSDEFNGVTMNHRGRVRPLIPRSFSSLSQAEEENGQSRIYLGIHWAFDKTKGIEQGRRVADYVFKKAFVPAQ